MAAPLYHIFTVNAPDALNVLYPIGGRSDSSNYLSSTIIYNTASETWTSGPALPLKRAFHCIVQLNGMLTMLIGGHNPDSLRDAWIYSWPEEMWTQVPDMPISRNDMACELFTDENGAKFVLVAGSSILCL